MRGIGTVALAVGILAACDSERAAQSPRATAQPDSPTVGLAAVRARGTLRVLTRNNNQCYYVWRGQSLGFDYEMAKRFADGLGVKLEIIVPPNWGDLIPMLERGEGDVIAAAMNSTEERRVRILFAKPYALTHMHVSWGKGRKPIKSIEDLSGKAVHVRQHSAYYGRLEKLNNVFIQAGREPVDIVIEGETMETEDILTDVAAGTIPYTLCDEHICKESRAYHPKLVVGPAVSDPIGVAWAVHYRAADLKDEIDRFFEREKAGGVYAETYKRYYAAPKFQAAKKRDELYVDESGRISPHDQFFKEAGAKFNLDWRLLAAMAYEESRFDPKAASWTGGRGLFGMDPITAKKLGAKKLGNPKAATFAAAELVAQLRYKFAQLPQEEDQFRMAVAAYHVGAEHITDARLLASQQKLDPNTWADISKTLPLLSRQEFVHKTKHGYIRGEQTVAYVDSIWARYRAYRHATGDRDVTQTP